MNNIISKIAVSTLLAGIAISSVTAATLTKSQLLIDGNETKVGTESFYIDYKTKGNNTQNLTFVPVINATKGSGFTLEFQNGGFKSVNSLFLCATADGNESNISTLDLTKVGNMFSRGTVVDGAMTAPQFQFSPDANLSLIDAGSHIYFMTKETCKEEVPAILGIGNNCQALTARVTNGKTTQGTSFNDYDTATHELGKTARLIKISCKVPTCQIDYNQEMKQFTTTPVASGINAGMSVGAAPFLTATLEMCPECDDTQVCATVIEVNASNTQNIFLEKMKFDLNFVNKKGVVANSELKLKDVTVMLDNNKSVDYKLDGTTLTLSGLKINGENDHIRITYTPNGTDVIPEGTISGKIYDLDTNLTDSTASDITFSRTENVATFIVSGLTKFTVPYMNTNYKTFVKITTKSDKSASLSAMITDQNGKTADVTLADIGAKGTVYLFSNKGPLFDAAKAAGLANAWTVDFTTTGAAIVDSYMTTATGERRVEAFQK